MALTLVLLIKEIESLEDVLGEGDGLLIIQSGCEMLVYLVWLEVRESRQNVDEGLLLQVPVGGLKGGVL